jgi:hypothetical protein
VLQLSDLLLQLPDSSPQKHDQSPVIDAQEARLVLDDAATGRQLLLFQSLAEVLRDKAELGLRGKRFHGLAVHAERRQGTLQVRLGHHGSHNSSTARHRDKLALQTPVARLRQRGARDRP